jgi:hypothetical protein
LVLLSWINEGSDIDTAVVVSPDFSLKKTRREGEADRSAPKHARASHEGATELLQPCMLDVLL